MAAMTRENAVFALKSLMGTRAETPFEKYKLLEERDKILRKVRQRVHDVHKATVFVGTCLDMCPEKERYEREVQKRLSSFELLADSTVDHRRAVKDYGRSAADQEEPLAHELRPASVLDMTMNYLLSEIAFQEPGDESHLPGWHDFLWKRTRAVRKDMTQQMLEGDIALSLLEKCARFHIFCAHRLCELDMGEFDQKMNTENLTKCLQSLKHMYEDMGKKGQTCKNEAEFRSYDVLLSLNDTNVLRQILTYNLHVRQSSHVRFALKLFSAMQNNNYVEFFRLVRRRATYLQACLAHRYFTEVRIRALNTFVRSYGANSQLPVIELVRWLGFETSKEAVHFGQLNGLTTHPQDGTLFILNRWQTIQQEETQPVPLKRANTLVEAKRLMNLGEILNGGPLYQVTLPIPVISFDEFHVYRSDKVVNDFLQQQGGGHVQERPEQVSIAPTLDDGIHQTNQKIKSMASVVLDSTVRSMVGETVEHEIIVAKVVQHVLKDVVSSTVRSIAGRVLDEERKRTAQKRQLEILWKAANSFKEKMLDKILKDVVASVSSQLAQEVRGRSFRKQMAQQLLIYAQTTRDKVIEASIKEQTIQLCSTYYHKEVQSPLESLTRIQQNLVNILTRKYYLRWRNFVLAKVHRRNVLEDFPCYPMGMAEEEDGPTFVKRKRYGNGSTSAYNWPDIMDARKFLTTKTDSVLKTTVGWMVRMMAMEEIRRQKVWKARFSQDRTMLAVGPATATDMENAKKRIFAQFSSHPSVYDDGKVREEMTTRKRRNGESAYSWMDSITIGDVTKSREATLTPSASSSSLVTPRSSTTYVENGNDALDEEDGRRRNYFSEIPLTASSAFRQETVELVKRLRSTVHSEKMVGDAELEGWKRVLNKDDRNGDGQME